MRETYYLLTWICRHRLRTILLEKLMYSLKFNSIAHINMTYSIRGPKSGPIKLLNMKYSMGYSSKKPNMERGGLSTYFFENHPGVFCFFCFTHGNSSQTKFHPWKFQIFVRFLGDSKAKNQDPGKFHIFSCSSLEITLCFLLTPEKSICYFFNTPRSFISSYHHFNFI